MLAMRATSVPDGEVSLTYSTPATAWFAPVSLRKNGNDVPPTIAWRVIYVTVSLGSTRSVVLVFATLT